MQIPPHTLLPIMLNGPHTVFLRNQTISFNHTTTLDGMVMMIRSLLVALLLLGSLPQTAVANTLTAREIQNEMLNKTIITHRFGMRVTMRYMPGGVVSAKALLGSVDGTWRARGNQICSTFPRGPAKGTSCVSFKRLGDNRYISSEGVRFRVVD
jgi:hypothetical protein